jgi:hypothetical protein
MPSSISTLRRFITIVPALKCKARREREYPPLEPARRELSVWGNANSHSGRKAEAGKANNTPDQAGRLSPQSRYFEIEPDSSDPAV